MTEPTNKDAVPMQVGRINGVGNETNFVTTIERLASNPSVDPDKLEKFMNLQERILDRNAEQAFNADMVLCQAEIRAVNENQRNTQTNSKYANLEAVIKSAKPIYTKHGFALSFYEGETQKQDHIRICVDVMHRDGHSKQRHLDMAVDDTGAKGSPTKTKIHGEGSSISYGRRYLTCMVFNIPTGDDDDGNAVGGIVYISESQKSKLADLLNAIYGADHTAFLQHIHCNTLEEIPSKDFNEHFNGLTAIYKKRTAKA